MSRYASCPYCGEEIDATVVFDPDRGDVRQQGHEHCPECHATRRAIQAIADGYITPEDCEPHGEDIIISPRVRRELEADIDEYDDPAKENQYLKGLGVGDDGESEDVGPTEVAQ